MNYQMSPSELLVRTTCLIVAKDKNGMSSSGSGCFFSTYRSDASLVWLVTNKHVLAEMASVVVNFSATRESAQGIETLALEVPIANIPSSKIDNLGQYDVSVIDFTQIAISLQSQGITLHSIPENLALSRLNAHLVDAIESVYMIGHPRGFTGEGNSPMVRRGTTATPAASTLDGLSKFYLDASVFPGSSGSPVFILDKGGYVNRDGTLVIGSDRCIFLGVFSHLLEQDLFADNPEMSFIPRENISLGIVQGARGVLETINQILGETDGTSR